MRTSPEKMYDDLLNFVKALDDAKSEEESAKIVKDFQSSNANGEIDYENGIRPFSAADARKSLKELKLDMIEYDEDNLVRVATSDPIMFKLIYDNLCDCIATVDRKMYPNWSEDWFLAETETRALAYYEQYEQFRQDTNGYGHGLNDFYSKNQYNSRIMAFVFTLKRKTTVSNMQAIIKYCSFVELPPMWSEERKIVSKQTFLYAYSQSTDDSIYSTNDTTTDGWHVLRNLRIGSDDSEYTGAAINTVKKLIQDVAQSVVLNADDSTSTSILAAIKMIQ